MSPALSAFFMHFYFFPYRKSLTVSACSFANMISFRTCSIAFTITFTLAPKSYGQDPIDQLKEKAKQPKQQSNTGADNGNLSQSFGENIYLEGSVSGNHGEEQGQMKLSPALTWQPPIRLMAHSFPWLYHNI